MKLYQRYFRYLRWKFKHYQLWRKLPNKLVKRWLRELVMYPERQGRGLLRTQDNKMCCLGQACDIIDPNGWRVAGQDGYHKTYHWDHATTALPESARKMLTLSTGCGVYAGETPVGYGCHRSLACLNDAGMTWPEIATFIVTHQQELFE